MHSTCVTRFTVCRTSFGCAKLEVCPGGGGTAACWLILVVFDGCIQGPWAGLLSWAGREKGQRDALRQAASKPVSSEEVMKGCCSEVLNTDGTPR